MSAGISNAPFTEGSQFLFFPALAMRGGFFANRFSACGAGVIGALAVNYIARQSIFLGRYYQLALISTLDWVRCKALGEESAHKDLIQKILFVATTAAIVASSTAVFLPLYAKTSLIALKILYCGVYQGFIRAACSPMLLHGEENVAWKNDRDSFLEPIKQDYENEYEAIGIGFISGSVQLGTFFMTFNPVFSMACAAASTTAMLATRAVLKDEPYEDLIQQTRIYGNT